MSTFSTKLQYFSLYPYHISSLLGFLPLELDLKKCEMHSQKSLTRRRIFWLLYVWIFIRGGSSLVKCVRIFFAQDTGVSRVLIPFLILTWFDIWLAGFTGYLAFWRRPEMTMRVFRVVFQGTRRSQKISIQDKIILLVAWNIPMTAGIYGAMVAMQPNAPFTLYSSLPESFKSIYSLGFTLCLEIPFAAYISGIFFFLVHILILFFDKCVEIGRGLVVRAQWRQDEAESCAEELLMRMRSFQLLLSLYNEAFAFVHFGWKVGVLLTVILLISAGILLIHKNTLFSMCYSFLGMQAILLYGTIFRQTFKFPMIIRQFKFKLDVKIKSDIYWNCDRKYLSRFVQTIPNLGIKDGEFYTFGRMSTLNFVGFSARNIIRALIVLRGH